VAQRTVTILVDDLTGKELASGGETVTFGLDGVKYEIDVDAKGAEKLRAAFAPYIRVGRRVTPSGRRIRRTKVGSNPAAIRAWAASNGIKISDRGRIPASVVEQYHVAGN
jgi:Lsr2